MSKDSVKSRGNLTGEVTNESVSSGKVERKKKKGRKKKSGGGLESRDAPRKFS